MRLAAPCSNGRHTQIGLLNYVLEYSLLVDSWTNELEDSWIHRLRACKLVDPKIDRSIKCQPRRGFEDFVKLINNLNLPKSVLVSLMRPNSTEMMKNAKCNWQHPVAMGDTPK